MAKLIDLEKIKPIDFPSTEMDGLDVVQYLNTLPTVDAVEVVHGRLSDPYIDEYYGEFSNCLECGTDNILPCYYCRKCGAKMDGERNG